MRKVCLITTAMVLATGTVLAQTEVPNIAGSYICKNRCDPMEGTATIDQAGDSLTITNEQSPAATTTGGFNNPIRSMPMGGAVVFAQTHLQLERW